jgi:hypothetical protein
MMGVGILVVLSDFEILLGGILKAVLIGFFTCRILRVVGLFKGVLSDSKNWLRMSEFSYIGFQS